MFLSIHQLELLYAAEKENGLVRVPGQSPAAPTEHPTNEATTARPAFGLTRPIYPQEAWHSQLPNNV